MDLGNELDVLMRAFTSMVAAGASSLKQMTFAPSEDLLRGVS